MRSAKYNLKYFNFWEGTNCMQVKLMQADSIRKSNSGLSIWGLEPPHQQIATIGYCTD